MPEGYTPQPLTQFGGLATLVDPTNLPNFMSPDCADVEFVPGLVKTRPGTVRQFPVNPTVNWNYLKTYISPQGLVRMIALDSTGQLWLEESFGALTAAGNPTLAQNAFGNSTSLFGREFIAIGDGQFGVTMPRQLGIFGPTQNFLERVSQGGPGQAPVVADENASVTITTSPNGILVFNNETISAISQSGNVVTLTFSTGGALGTYCQVGDSIQIAGFTGSSAGYNGNFEISNIVSPTSLQYVATTTGLPSSSGGNISFGIFEVVTTSGLTMVATQLANITGATNTVYNAQYEVRFGGTNATTFFLYNGDLIGNTASGGGSLALGGSVVAGKHMVSVIFVTDQGYLTQPAPPSFWNAGGGKRALCTQIAIGPSNIVQRILCFTAVNADSFFYTGAGSPLYSGNMIINDNVTTSVAVDFTDAVLLEGINVDDLFDLVELGECQAVTSYQQRLIWSGERNKLAQNAAGFNNLGFDGGFNQTTGCPLGWTPDPTSFSGGGEAPFTYWGGAYGITGNGSPVVGKISQTAVQDWTGTPIINTNTGYSVRALISLSPTSTPTNGTIHIALSSVLQSFTTGLSLTVSQLTTGFVEYIGVLTTGLTTIPSDLVIEIYADGTPTNGGIFVVDSVEVFPTGIPNNVTIVRASRVPDEEGLYSAGSYNGVDGFQDVGSADGFAVACSFVRRDFLYHVKERGVWVTSDDPNNEFANWTLQQVSKTVGTPSARGVGQGDDFDIIAGIDGVYLFQNGQFGETPLSTEIRPTWDSINWAYGYLLDVKVDPKRKRVYIAVPLGANATSNNTVLTLDYTMGWGDPQQQNGFGRQWAPWNIPCNSMNLIQRQNDVWQLFFGNNVGSGVIVGLDLTGTVYTDSWNAVGAKINDYWQSGYFKDTARLNFGVLTANVVGSGMLQPILRKGDQGWITQIRPWTMSALNFNDLERNLPASLETSRLAVRLNSVGTGDHFSLQSLTPWARESAYAATRGINK